MMVDTVNSKLHVMILGNSLSIGGAAKNIQRFATALSRDTAFEVSVASWSEGGERAALISSRGIPVYILNQDPDILKSILKKHAVDILHVHRGGWAEPGPISIAKAAGVPIVIETNIFGRKDNSREDSLIDLTLFKSKASWLKYVLQNQISSDQRFLRWGYLYNPVELEEIKSYELSSLELKLKREKLGLKPNEKLIGRIGRADEGKFGRIMIDMLPHLFKKVSDVKLLIVGAPDFYKKELKERGFADRCIFHPIVLEPKELYELYYCLDVLVHSSPTGESCGNVISEAMACARPVVSNATHFNRPWLDNAQIEQIDHGETGLIANYPKAYADAVAQLLRDNSLRSKMGENGRKKIENQFDIKMIVPKLKKIYLALALKKSIPIAVATGDLLGSGTNVGFQEELSNFEQQYAGRLAKSYLASRWRELVYGYQVKLDWHFRKWFSKQ